MIATSLLELFERGGPVMWPILGCSIAALAIAFERFFVLSWIDVDNPHLPTDLVRALENRQLAVAEKLSHQISGPLGAMVRAGISRSGKPREEILEVVEETGSQEMLALERYVPLLGTLGHLAPLLGLLGTVTGLVRCFQIIQEKATTIHPVNPGDLAGGIWEALLTTVFGLLVAIPAYGMYNYLAYRINRISSHLQICATKLASLLAEKTSSSDPGNPSISRTQNFAPKAHHAPV